MSTATPPRTVEWLTELYKEAGLSLREIQRETGIPYSTVKGCLDRAGVELRPRGAFEGNNNVTRATYEQRRTAEYLYKVLGWSCAEIGEHFGISHSSARDWLIAHGVELRPRSESIRLRFERRPRKRN